MRAILHHPHAEESIFPKQTDLSRDDSSSLNRSTSMLLTLACDVTFLLMSLGAGLLLQALVVGVWPPTGNMLEKEMVEWMPLGSIASSAGWYLLQDIRRCWQRHRSLPFDYTAWIFQQIYWRRLELILWAIASHLVLLCLCLLLPDKPLFSKVFLSSIVGLIALAVHKSIPAQRQAFAAASSVFSVSMFVIMVASILN